MSEEERVMAYIVYDSLGDAMRSGPFPNKAGEFCGSVSIKRINIREDNIVILSNPDELLPHARLGNNPLEFHAGRLAGDCIDLYLVKDGTLPEDAVEIDTDMFTEEVVSGEHLSQKPINLRKIRRKELCF
jgi:hypothetical protein